MKGVMSSPTSEEFLLLNLTALGSAIFIPGSSIAIMVGSTVGCKVVKGCAEVFRKYGKEAAKLEAQTALFLAKLKELHAVELKNGEEIKKLKTSLQESYRIMGVAARILHEERLKLERKVEKLEPKIKKQQSTVAEVLERARKEQALSESIRLKCEQHTKLGLLELAKRCDELADELVAGAKNESGNESGTSNESVGTTALHLVM